MGSEKSECRNECSGLQGERRIGVNACKPVIYGKNPSADCCLRVRVSHVECVCPVVTPKLVALIDLNRAICRFKVVEGEFLATSSAGVSPLHEV